MCIFKNVCVDLLMKIPCIYNKLCIYMIVHVCDSFKLSVGAILNVYIEPKTYVYIYIRRCHLFVRVKHLLCIHICTYMRTYTHTADVYA